VKEREGRYEPRLLAAADLGLAGGGGDAAAPARLATLRTRDGIPVEHAAADGVVFHPAELAHGPE
jgi:hypothetical protein